MERLAGVDALDEPLTPEEAVAHARDGLNGFIGALALADDAASIAQSYTTRLRNAWLTGGVGVASGGLGYFGSERWAV